MIRGKACVRLDDLPHELKCEIVRWVSKDEWGKSSLIDIACVNSHYSKIARELFDRFEFDSVQDFGGSLFQNFVKTMMLDDGARAVHIRRLHLNTGWWERRFHTDENETGSDTNTADLFGTWVMDKMKRLKEVSVAYKSDLTFLSTGLPKTFKALSSDRKGDQGSNFGSKCYLPILEMKGTVDVSFLPNVLSAPSLKHLDLGGQTMVHEEVLCTDEVLVAQSSIQYLSLSVGTFSNQAMLKLLQIPRGLRSFRFTPKSFWDRDSEGTHDRYLALNPAELPATSTLGVGLAS